MMVLEESKSWAEADGDTAEAIDFCEFYAREMERLAAAAAPDAVSRRAATSSSTSPWASAWSSRRGTFRSRSSAGMTTAALVAGNTVVLKPSSDAAGIATMFVEACEEAGVPDGVLNFLTGGGSTVGNALVESPKTRLIAFTGSRDVGVQISEKAGRVVPGQIWIKRADPRDGRQGLHPRRRDGGPRGRRQRASSPRPSGSRDRSARRARA